LEPIQFTGNFIWPTGDTTLAMPPPPEVRKDSVIKVTPVVIAPVAAKLVKTKAPSIKSKSKVQAKALKSKPKLNNKPKNNSLNKKNKTAKALMPKKSKSPTTKN
jgi:hypothetical protein